MTDLHKERRKLKMNLITEYTEAIHEMDEVQTSGLDKRNKVKKNNRLANRMRKIASEIETKYPDMKNDFYQLLFHEEAIVRNWVAHHILEVMNYDEACRKNALKEITDIAMNDKGFNGFGNKMWLAQWYEEHPTDRELL